MNARRMDRAIPLTEAKEGKASKSSPEPEVSSTAFKPSVEGMKKSESESIIYPKGSEDSNEVQSRGIAIGSSASEADEETAEEDRWYKSLKSKMGLGINAEERMKAHPELASKKKSELMLRLAYELCLAENTECDPMDDSVENQRENKKYARFDKKRIFALFAVADELMEQNDRKKFVELVYQEGNVQLLEMIFQQEGGGEKSIYLDCQYPWKGHFTGYSKPIELFKQVIDNRCSSEIVLCIAEKIYGPLHIIYNGTQYIEDSRFRTIRIRLNQPSSLVEECLKKATKFGYKRAVLVMLGGDIYHCFRLMKYRKFREETEFLEAYTMIKEAVVDVISSWAENNENKISLKGNVKHLLNQGIETDMSEMRKADLVDELEKLGIEVGDRERNRKEKLIQILKGNVDQDGEIKLKLRKTVVGAFISVLFFKHQEVVMENREQRLTLELTGRDKLDKLNYGLQLNNKISNGEPIEDIVLGFIKKLNSSSHVNNGWFLREVLAEIVNDKAKFGKLRAVCTAICKKPMQELLKGVKVNENVMNVLKFVGVYKDSLVFENSNNLVTEISDTATSSILRNMLLSKKVLVPVRSNSILEGETSNTFSVSNIASSNRQSSADAGQTVGHAPLPFSGITAPVNLGKNGISQDKPIIPSESGKPRHQSLVTIHSSSFLSAAASETSHSASHLSDSSVAGENSMLRNLLLTKKALVPARSNSISEGETSNTFGVSNIASSNRQSPADAGPTVGHAPLPFSGITAPVNLGKNGISQDKPIIPSESGKPRHQSLVTIHSSSFLSAAASETSHSASHLSDSSVAGENSKLSEKSLKEPEEKKEAARTNLRTRELLVKGCKHTDASPPSIQNLLDAEY